MHVDGPEHGVSLDKSRILTVESGRFEGGVGTAVCIRVMEPGLSRDGGRCFLPAMWARLGGPESGYPPQMVLGLPLELRSPT